MEDIYSLIHSLTSAEWHSFQNYLTCFSSHDPAQLKQLQLAKNLMDADECPDEARICIKLYGVKKDIRFDILKSALKEKVLDFLTTDISCDKKNELDEADYAIVKINKKSAQLRQLYFSKKRIPFLYGLLDEIILLSKKYEQYSTLVEHLRLKKALVTWKSGREEFEKNNNEMEFYWNCNRMVNKAEQYYYELIMLSEFSSRRDPARLSSLFQNACAELDVFYSETRSPLIKYNKRFLELGYYLHRENHSKARSICLDLIDIVRNNKSVYRRQRIGVVYDNLSRCEYYLGRFKQAADWALEAQKHFNAGSENYCIALEQEFYALFAQEEYEQAVEIANKMIASATRKELGEFRYAKYNFLLANALFKQRRFTEALHILSQELEISKDKAGWETGLRTLKIMTLIEMLKLDEAGLAVLSMKQFFKYNDKKTPISPRDKKILNLLLVAERAGFMFSTLNGNTDKYMEPLCSDEKTFRWEPFTHEVIPFHKWFAGKMPVHHHSDSKTAGGKIKLSKHPKSAKKAKEKVAVLK